MVQWIRVTFNKKGKGREEFHALIAGIVEAASGFSIADVYPSFGTLLHSISGMKKKFKKLVEQTNRILDPIIEEHMTKKKDRGNNDNDDYNEDLVDVLLKFHKDNAQPTQEFSLSTDNVKAVLLVSQLANTPLRSLDLIKIRVGPCLGRTINLWCWAEPCWILGWFWVPKIRYFGQKVVGFRVNLLL